MQKFVKDNLLTNGKNLNCNCVVVIRELAAAELMSLKLKQEGAMVCRQISYDGVDISSEKVPINQEEDEAYEQLYAKYTNMVPT